VSDTSSTPTGDDETPEQADQGAATPATGASDTGEIESTEPSAAPESSDGGAQQDVTGAMVRGFITLVVLGIAVALGYLQTVAPATVGADAPADQFSAERAMGLMERIAGTDEPRPVGSVENARARAELVAAVEELGYDAIERKNQLTTQAFSPVKAIAIDVPENTSPLETADTVNILVRVPGTDPDHSQAILVAGHYDSVPSGPGVSDDLHSVVSMVETLRAMKNLPPLKHDVIFLMTDAEEPGERGARSFMLQDPWAKDVQRVLNFEARGVRGKSLLFEVSQLNQELLDAYKAAQPNPQSSSLFFELYLKIKNNTDFSVFDNLGKPGLNFAYSDGLNRYHTPGDSLENLDPGSMQNAGDAMLGLVQQLGNEDTLDVAPADDLTWFNIGPIVVDYPVFMGFIIIVVGFGVWLAALLVGLRKGVVTGRAIGRGVGTTVLAIIAAIVISQVVLAIIYLFRPDTRLFLSLTPTTIPPPYRSVLYSAVIMALVVAATIALFVLARRKHRVEGLAIGVLGIWFVLAVLTQIGMQGGAYLFYLPLLALSIALLVRIIWEQPWVTLVVDLLAATFSLVILVDDAVIGLQMMSLSMIAVIAALVVLIVSSLCAVLDALQGIWKWTVPIGLTAAAVVMLIPGLATPLIGPNFRQPDTLAYSIDADTNTAQWLSYDEEPDEWTQEALGTDPVRETAPITMEAFFPGKTEDWTVMTNEADTVLPVAPPTLSVNSDRTKGDTRTVEFTLASGRDAISLWYTLQTSGQLQDLQIGPQKMNMAEGTSWSVIGYAPPKEGYRIKVTLSAGSDLEVIATDATWGFPDDPALGVSPRPDWTMWDPEPHAFQMDPVMVSKTFSVGRTGSG